MDPIQEIEKCAADIASNVSRIVFGDEQVKMYRRQVEELLQLERELERSVVEPWEHGVRQLRVLKETGKNEWHGESRRKADMLLDVEYRAAIDNYYHNYIKTTWLAIQKRVDELQALIDEEEGIIAKLTAQNLVIKNKQTDLEKKAEAQTNNKS